MHYKCLYYSKVLQMFFTIDRSFFLLLKCTESLYIGIKLMQDLLTEYSYLMYNVIAMSRILL